MLQSGGSHVISFAIVHRQYVGKEINDCINAIKMNGTEYNASVGAKMNRK